jgi:hypothetical protein
MDDQYTRRFGPTLASAQEEDRFSRDLVPVAAFESMDRGGASRARDDAPEDESGEEGGGSERSQGTAHANVNLTELYAGVLQTAGVRLYQVVIPDGSVAAFSVGAGASTASHSLIRDDGPIGLDLTHGLWAGAAVTVAYGSAGAASVHRELVGGETMVPAEGASLGTVVDVRSEDGFMRTKLSFWDEDTGGRVFCDVRHRASDHQGTRDTDRALHAATRMAKERSWAASRGVVPFLLRRQQQQQQVQQQQRRPGQTEPDPEQLHVMELPLLRAKVIGGATVTGLAGVALAALVTDDALCTLYAREALLTLLMSYSESVNSGMGLSSALQSRQDRTSVPTSIPLPMGDMIQLFRLIAASEIQRSHTSTSTSQTGSGRRGSLSEVHGAGGAADGPAISSQSSSGALLDAAVGGEAWAFERGGGGAGAGGTAGGEGGGCVGGASGGGGGAVGSIGARGSVSRMLSTILRQQLVSEAAKLRRGSNLDALPLTRALINEVVRNVVGESGEHMGSQTEEQEARDLADRIIVFQGA